MPKAPRNSKSCTQHHARSHLQAGEASGNTAKELALGPKYSCFEQEPRCFPLHRRSPNTIVRCPRRARMMAQQRRMERFVWCVVGDALMFVESLAALKALERCTSVQDCTCKLETRTATR